MALAVRAWALHLGRDAVRLPRFHELRLGDLRFVNLRCCLQASPVTVPRWHRSDHLRHSREGSSDR